MNSMLRYGENIELQNLLFKIMNDEAWGNHKSFLNHIAEYNLILPDNSRIVSLLKALPKSEGKIMTPESLGEFSKTITRRDFEALLRKSGINLVGGDKALLDNLHFLFKNLDSLNLNSFT